MRSIKDPMSSAIRPVVLTLALAAGVSAADVHVAAAPQESPKVLPGKVAAEAGVFVPSLRGADYVVTLRVQRGWGPPGSDTHVVTRHGDWVRMDVVRDGRTTTRYPGLALGVEASLIRDTAGGYSYVWIKTRPDSSARGMDYRSFRTGETDVVLGEPCDVWKVYRSPPDERGYGGFARLGCVTADGIELWQRTIGTDSDVLSSAEAMRLERRSVDAAEVRPPDDLLSLERWFGAGASTRDAIPAGELDFEVVLAHSEDLGEPTVTVRRRYPWRYEDRYDEGRPRRLFIWREDRVTWLDVYVGPQGAAERLAMSNRPFDVRTQPRDSPVPLPDKPPETLLGERCTWLDMVPGMMDAERHECRTQDGIPLRIWFWSRGGAASYSAIRLSRRPIEFSEVMPPPVLLERSRWQLPD
jgi:hypothetical protein